MKILNILFWIFLLFCIAITLFSVKATDFLSKEYWGSFQIIVGTAYLIFIFLALIRFAMKTKK